MSAPSPQPSPPPPPDDRPVLSYATPAAASPQRAKPIRVRRILRLACRREQDRLSIAELETSRSRVILAAGYGIGVLITIAIIAAAKLRLMLTRPEVAQWSTLAAIFALAALLSWLLSALMLRKRRRTSVELGPDGLSITRHTDGQTQQHNLPTETIMSVAVGPSSVYVDTEGAPLGELLICGSGGERITLIDQQPLNRLTPLAQALADMVGLQDKTPSTTPRPAGELPSDVSDWWADIFWLIGLASLTAVVVVIVLAVFGVIR